MQKMTLTYDFKKQQLIGNRLTNEAVMQIVRLIKEHSFYKNLKAASLTLPVIVDDHQIRLDTRTRNDVLATF